MLQFIINAKLKKHLLISALLLTAYCFMPFILKAQQLPYYTQFKSSSFMLNPAVAGTQGTLYASMNYRMQWVGFDDAPKTSGISLNGRLFEGKMGAGLYMMQDEVGPSKQTNYGASYAYHIRFPDCELSAGLAGNYTKYTLMGSKMTIHNSQDPSIDQTLNYTSSVPDASAGIYLYNDRFHIGISALHLLQSKAEFYKGDSTKKGFIQYATQVYSTFGYNYSQNPDYVFENTLFVNYVKSVPLMMDYTLRVHYMGKVFFGASVRLRDAIAIHVGATFLESFQVAYSYDILISKFRSYSSGSHEIVLKYSFNRVFDDKNRTRVKKFAHQKYNTLF
ncbi:MAG: type IX secretion system membrane protein PorP/SprF [Bacteroidota bacterium]